MGELSEQEMIQIVMSAPGGHAKVVFDDELTILEGDNSFYSFLGIKKDSKGGKEVKSLFKVVYSADIIYINRQIAAQKANIKNGINLDFRVLQSDGSFKWIMVTGSLLEEQYEGKYPVLSCITVDISGQKAKQKQLEEQENYHRITTDLARDITFEYTIATDTLKFSELFREAFGVEANVQNFRSKLQETTLIHPDELNGVKKIFSSMMAGKKQAIFEFRMLPKGGEPIRYRCYASIILDENRNPIKLVGKLTLVLEAKKTKENTVASKPIQVTIDSNTNLPDIASTIALISDSINKQEENGSSALLVIELGQFAALNKLMSTISNTSIICEMASELKKMFRSTDVVGMLGQDSYVIIMKNITSAKMVLCVANEICESFKHKYQQENMLVKPEIFIGIEFVHGHKGLYETYISNALVALETVKKKNTSGFEFFNKK